MGEQKIPSTTGDITALDYLIFAMKWKHVITGITVFCFVMILIITLLLPKKYQAETKVLLPLQGSQSMSAQILSQLGGLIPTGGLGGVRTVGDLYVSLLTSRSVLDRMVDRFSLMNVYNRSSREKARRDLLKALSAQDLKKSGLLVIAVEDRDPKRSADMANAFVEELRNINRYIAVSEASQKRLFFEEHLKSAKEVLILAEEALKGYQEQTGAIEIKEQTKAVINSVAQLRAQIAAKEVELKVFRSYATSRNPDRQKIEDQLRGMREQLSMLESRRGSNTDALMSTANLPQAGTGYVRKLRDMKYAETLYELLMKQYEMAKIDEARDAAIIQVVEKAVPPEKKSKPRSAFYIISITLFGIVIAFVTAIFMEYRERISGDPTKRDRLERLKFYASGSLLRKPCLRPPE